MTLGIILLYVLTLASFVPPLILAGFLWSQGRVPLAGNFLKFQASYLVFLTSLFSAYLVLTLVPDRRWEAEVFFNTLFFVLYGALLWFLARFMFELVQHRWEGPWRRVVEALVLAGVFLPLGIHAAVFEGTDRALALRLALNGGYFVVFLGAVTVLLVRSVFFRRALADPWKRRTLGGVGLIFMGAFPFFLVDAFWPVLQDNRGWIPRGLNVQVVPVVVWNLWLTRRWFVFPLHEAGPEAAGEPSSELLGILTVREREIALLILKGRSNQEICDALGVRMGTTKNHIYNIFNKTGASSRKELCTMLLSP